MLGVFNNSTCKADNNNSNNANYVKSHTNDLNNYSAWQSFSMPRPKWANELHCAMEKIKNQKYKIEFNWNSKNIFYSLYLQKDANILNMKWADKTEKLFKICIQHQSKKSICCARKTMKNGKVFATTKFSLLFASSVPRERNLRTQFTKQIAFSIRRT